MNQFPISTVHLGRVRLRISVVWLLVALALSAASGWSGAELLFDSPSMSERILSSGGITAGALVFVSVRELAIGWYHRRTRDDSQRRVLYPLGSTSEGYRLAPSPAWEFRQALVGISAPLFAGTLGTAVAFLIGPDSSLVRLGLAFAMTGVFVGAVHLMPALPFSGGSLLRAVFWFLDGGHRNSTRIVFLYSQLVAIVALGFGLFLLTWRAQLVVPGIWSVAIGFIVLNASREEFLRAHLIFRASRVRAADAVSGLNPTIKASETVANAVDILLEQKTNGPGLIRDRDRFVGMLTLQIVREVPRGQWTELSAREVMVPVERVADTPPGASLLQSLRARETSDADAVLVRREGGEIAGIISAEIAPRLLLRRAEERAPSAEPGTTRCERTSSS